MPKERISTDAGYIEVQWAKSGLVCIVSAIVKENPDGSVTTTDVMHQFNSRRKMKPLIRALRRADRQMTDQPELNGIFDAYFTDGPLLKS